MYKQVLITNKTWLILRSDRMKAVDKYSKKEGIEKALIKAIIKKESSFWPFAIKEEMFLKKAPWYVRTLNRLGYINNYQFCSYGFMQVLYGIAKSYGFKGYPFDLFDPDNNIKYGVMHLKWLFKRYKDKDDIKDVISAYNQGSNKKDDNGDYCNKQYVDHVYDYYKKYGGKL